MQELKLLMRNGQTLCVCNSSESDRVVSEFGRFLDEFRLSEGASKEKLFIFSDPLLIVRLSEVAAVSPVFKTTESEQRQKEQKKRLSRKLSETKELN